MATCGAVLAAIGTTSSAVSSPRLDPPPVTASGTTTITVGNSAPLNSADPDAHYSAVDASSIHGTIADLDVNLTGFNIAHFYAASMTLLAPDGRQIDLMQRACEFATGPVADATYVIDDEIGHPFHTNVAPGDTACAATGSYQPSDYADLGGELHALSAFDGADVAGQWTLFVQSFEGGSPLTLTGGWSLTFTVNPPPPPPPPPPDTTPPDTAITLMPRSSVRHTARLRFVANETGSRFRCKRDRGSYRACSSPKSLRHLAIGSHVFRVKAVDSAGNADPTPAVARWKVTRRT